jgi:hypothetical protein
MGEALPRHRLDPTTSPRPRSTLVLGFSRHRRGGIQSEGAGERGDAMMASREDGRRPPEKQKMGCVEWEAGGVGWEGRGK